MRVSYSGYYATLPRSREGFNSPYPLTNKKELFKEFFFVCLGMTRGIEQVGSETRVEAEAETSERASDEYPGDIRTPTQDE